MKEIEELPMEPFDKDISITLTDRQTKEAKRKGWRFIQTGSKKGKVNSTKTRMQRWDFGFPYTLQFRVVRFMLDTGEYETIATSLDRELFPSDSIKELYHMRWGIETSFRELKYAIGVINFHARKDELLQQEIYAGLILYNFCERITGAVVIQQKSKNIYVYQVNYTMAIHICRDYYAQGRKYELSVIDEVRKYILPVRPGRRDKRNIKVKGVVSFIYRVAA